MSKMINYETGAKRESKEGKGRYDLISPIAEQRRALRMEYGAKIHGEHNWEKGLPIKSYIDSALRHINQYKRGYRDEDHLAAAAVNLDMAMHTEETHPGLALYNEFDNNENEDTNNTDEHLMEQIENHFEENKCFDFYNNSDQFIRDALIRSSNWYYTRFYIHSIGFSAKPSQYRRVLFFCDRLFYYCHKYLNYVDIPNNIYEKEYIIPIKYNEIKIDDLLTTFTNYQIKGYLLGDLIPLLHSSYIPDTTLKINHINIQNSCEKLGYTCNTLIEITSM